MDEKELKTLTDGFNKENELLKKGLEDLTSKVDEIKADELRKSLETLTKSVEKIGKIGETELPEYLKNIQEQQDAQAKELLDLKDNPIKEVTTLKGLIKNLFKTDESVKELKKGILSNEGYEMKSAAEMTTSSYTADAGAVKLAQVIIPGVEKHPWAANPVFAAVTKIVVNDKKNSITWNEENARTDGAAGIAESGAFPQSSTTWVQRVANFFKIGAYADYTEETMEDSDEFAFELNDLLTNGTLRKVEYDLLLGNGTNTFTGLIYASGALAKAFAAPSSVATNVINPGIFDVLRSAQLQVREGYGGTDTNKKGYMANLGLVSPGTLAMKDMEKTTDGVYMKPFWATDGNKVSGMLVMESDDIGADQFLVGDFTQIKLYIKRALNLKKTDSDASKFLDDVITVKASMRIAQKLATLKRYAFVYGTFADGKTQIELSEN